MLAAEANVRKENDKFIVFGSFMKTFSLFLYFIAILLGSSNVEAYEDTPFEFHTEVSDSVLFLLHGIEHREIHLEYFPGEQELYLNGEPVFNLSFGPKEEDECWEFLDEIETARENLKAGLTCSQCYARYQNDRNVLVWEIGDWLEAPEQTGESDWLLTLKLFSFCSKYGIAPDIVSLMVWNSHAYICFATTQYENHHNWKIPSDQDRSIGFGPTLPFREKALATSQRIIRQAQEMSNYSTIHAIPYAGGYSSMSRPGTVSRGRLQLQRILEKGEYVEGPILKFMLE